MSHDRKGCLPSHPMPENRTGILTGFDPGVRTLEAGSRIEPCLQLPVPGR